MSRNYEALARPPASSRPAPMAVERPARTGLGDKYRLIRLLGKGGMAQVYLAKDRVLNRRLALKILIEGRARFGRSKAYLREARAAAAVSHPNITHVYEVGELDGQPYIAMEYVDGVSLLSLRQEGPMPPRQVVELGLQIADGLAAAHGRGIVHRDIKPSNLLMQGQTVKILDFGLAKMTSQAWARSPDHSGALPIPFEMTPDPDHENALLGTPAYMSPEQAMGWEPDPRSDIFSLGIVLYELLTGKQLFAMPSVGGTLLKVIRYEPPLLRSRLPELDPELEALLDRCLAKDRDERYPSADALGEALHVLAEPRPQRSAKKARVRRPTRRGMLGRFFGAFGQRPRRQQGRTVAVLPLRVEGAAAREMGFLAEGLAESLIHRLSRSPGLSVVSVAAASRFADSDLPIGKVAEALGADAVVTGRVVRLEEEVEIALELVDADSGLHLWGDRLRRGLSNPYELQALVAARMADELRVQLTGADRERIEELPAATDSKAHRLYLHGLYHWHRADAEAPERATRYFRRALEVDPDFALGHAGIAMTHGVTLADITMEPRIAMPIAMKAADEALKRDPSLAEAKTVLGAAELWYRWNPTRAEDLLLEAIDVNPNYALAHHQYGWLLALTGRLGESAAELEKALELDPLSLVIATDTHLPYSIGGRFDEAFEQCRAVIRLDPSFFLAHFVTGWIHTLARDFSGAIPHLTRAKERGGSSLALSWLGYALAKIGREKEARTQLRELEALGRDRWVAPLRRALIHAGLGELDQVFHHLEAGLEAREWGMLFIDSEPAYASARRDPRWASLISRRKAFTEAVPTVV